MFFFFFYGLYEITEIKQAFKKTCLDKMLIDGWFDMSMFIHTRYAKNELLQSLKKNKSKYAVLYERSYPIETEAQVVWNNLIDENFNSEYIELSRLESLAIVNWIYNIFKKISEREEFTKALLNEIKAFHRISNKVEFTKGVVYNRERVEIVFASSLDQYFRSLPPSNSTGLQMFYRGHSDSNYMLMPSLLRTKTWEKSEFSMYNELMINCPREFDNCRTHLEKLVKMQHYGLPTRLLDITRNPLVALYFACCDNPESYGEVILLSVKPNEIKYPQSDTVTILASLPQISREMKDEYRLLANDPAITDIMFNTRISRLIHEIRQEKPAFQADIRKADLLDSFIVFALKSNERIIKQDGAFILCGLINGATSLNQYKYMRNKKKVVLLIDKKEKILKQLSDIGVNYASLFPEIECVSEHIKKRYS